MLQLGEEPFDQVAFAAVAIAEAGLPAAVAFRFSTPRNLERELLD